MTRDEKIARLEEFKESLRKYDGEHTTADDRRNLRSFINQEKPWVRQEVMEAKCHRLVLITPPPGIGGPIINGSDPFDNIFEHPYGQSVVSHIIDIIDATIGVLRSLPEKATSEHAQPLMEGNIVTNYAFIAMPMDEKIRDLDDVLDAIKQVCQGCGIQAERVDEAPSNERITDRIVESIRRARFVIVDLTHQKPNVYWEAGYAHGIKKTPIYIARKGTKIEFDLKDYPVIFFATCRELKFLLQKRLRSSAETPHTQGG